jgi:hypothetical protein
LELIKQRQASSQQAEAWCEQNGVNVHTMADAAHRLRKLGLLEPPQKRTNEEWLEMVSAQRASGLTVEEWCAQNGVNLHTMADRICRLRKLGLWKEPRPAGGRHSERRTTTELRKYEQFQAAQWVEVSGEAATEPEAGEICVEIGRFKIIVPLEFSEAAFSRVCKTPAALC